MSVRKVGLFIGALFLAGVFLAWPKTHAVTVTEEPTLVGATYYGGNWDDSKKAWIIDNTDQCNRIRAGEFTAKSLNGVISATCNDDNGEGYVEGTKLHNQVSFAELSNNPAARDFAALGNLPLGAKLEISYQGKCLVAEKLDVGQGGGPVSGYQRSLDLWWQTARSLDFKNGFDVMSVRRVPDSTPLTELGKSYPCIQDSSRAEANQTQASDPTAPPAVMGDSSENTSSQPESEDGANLLITTLAIGMIAFSVLALLGLLRHIKK